MADRAALTDAHRSPGIDIGQSEGGFLQALSWATRERFVFKDATGEMLTARPDLYYPATAYELPRDFHSMLLPNSRNPANQDVFHVKGTGEPGASPVRGVVRVACLIVRARRVQSGRCCVCGHPASC